MPINPSAVATQSVTEQLSFAIEILNTQPIHNAIISPTRTPGSIAGWYNGVTNSVELYIVNRAGNRFLKVT